MNKKYLVFGLMGLFAMAFAAAGLIQYYGSVETTISVNQPIKVNGTVESSVFDIVSCDAGDTCSGSDIVITNDGNDERTVAISNDAVEGEVEVSYVGTLGLTKKNTITWQPTEDKLEITYVVIGDSLEVTGVPSGYTLIYYKDVVIELGERLENPQPAIIVTSDMGNLPQVGDANADVSADYCNNSVDDYDSCRGAKLWVVLTSDITNGELNWANMADYYYETNLVQYSTTGEIIIYGDSGLTITPEYTLDAGLNESDQVITSTINVA